MCGRKQHIKHTLYYAFNEYNPLNYLRTILCMLLCFFFPPPYSVLPYRCWKFPIIFPQGLLLAVESDRKQYTKTNCLGALVYIAVKMKRKKTQARKTSSYEQINREYERNTKNYACEK